MTSMPVPPQPSSRRAKRPKGVVILVVGALVLMAAASWIPLPYYSEGPGPAREVTPLIMFEGHDRFPHTGRLAMTTVSFERLTPVTAVAAWLDPNQTVIDDDLLYEPGVDHDLADQRSFSQMDQSKIDAAAVVLRELTRYPRDHGDGVLIEATAPPPCPASDRLFPGDRVVAIDGEPVDSVREASRVIGSTPPGREMVFDLDVDGESERATFARERCVEGSRRPLVGVSMIDAFPFPITISSGDVGGPSAGLLWAVGLYELMTPGDLTAGRFIAGTGTIGLDGTVGAIGGIRDKVVAAREAGADVFLVPDGNMEELDGVDAGGMALVPVATFDEAIAALEGSTTT
jgi:PDZ domain-containing protein